MSQFPPVIEEIQDLSLEQINTLLARARRIKQGYFAKTHTFFEDFKDHTVITYFSENSTRTKISFIQSIYDLGLRHINFDVHLSSVHKGENLNETLQTLKHLGADLLIYRTNNSKELSFIKENPPFKIINAGDGINQHPTQALLDLFTMIELGHNPKGKTVAIIGDSRHSRVSHSLIDLLSLWGANIILTGPESLLPNQIPNKNTSFCTDLDEALSKADILYPLRIQFERHEKTEEKDFIKQYTADYGLTLEKLNNHGKQTPIYHAGPANIGVEIDQNIVNSPLYMAYKQVSHSIPMRTAIIRSVLKGAQSGSV